MQLQALDPRVQEQYQRLKAYDPDAAIAYLDRQLAVIANPEEPLSRAPRVFSSQKPLKITAQPKAKPRLKTEAALRIERGIALILDCSMEPLPQVEIQALIRQETGNATSLSLFRRVVAGLVTDKILVRSIAGKSHTFCLCPPHERRLNPHSHVVEFWGKRSQRSGVILQCLDSKVPGIRSFRVRLDSGMNILSTDERLFPIYI